MSESSAISEHHLQDAVRTLFNNHRYILTNAYVFDWESDLFSVTKTGTVYEVEMKCSKADYRKDFEKRKHFFFKHAGSGRFQERDPQEKSGYNIHNYDYDYVNRKMIIYQYCTSIWHDTSTWFIPNRFYYACPPGIIQVKDLPPYAGLILVEDFNTRIIKQAPFLHKRPMLQAQMLQILLDKFWYLSQRQRWKLAINKVEFDEAGSEAGSQG